MALIKVSKMTGNTSEETSSTEICIIGIKMRCCHTFRFQCRSITIFKITSIDDYFHSRFEQKYPLSTSQVSPTLRLPTLYYRWRFDNVAFRQNPSLIETRFQLIIWESFYNSNTDFQARIYVSQCRNSVTTHPRSKIDSSRFNFQSLHATITQSTQRFRQSDYQLRYFYSVTKPNDYPISTFNSFLICFNSYIVRRRNYSIKFTRLSNEK